MLLEARNPTPFFVCAKSRLTGAEASAILGERCLLGIELMIMPLSRYWAGDYITPTMREVYTAGCDFTIIRPGEPAQTLERWSPFGGLNAPQERISLISFVTTLMKRMPRGIPDQLWDEASNFNPWIHKFDRREISRFFYFAIKALKVESSSHLATAKLFLPVDFPYVLNWEDFYFGSLHQLQRELESIPVRADTEKVYMIFDEAVRMAISARLPLIYDD